MSLLSRIVKSIAVVDRRPLEKQIHPPGVDRDFADHPVIKPHHLMLDNPSKIIRGLPTRESALEELYAVMADVEEAKIELKALQQQLSKTRKELLQPPDSGEDPDGKATAAKVIAQAHREAEKLLEEAGQEAELMKQQAGERGHQEGYEAGRLVSVEQFRAENQPKAEQLQHIIQRLNDYEKERMEKNETELVRLCTAVAKRIVGRELQTDPSAIKDMLWETVDSNRREESIKIVLAPDLLPLKAKASQEICDLLRGMGANITVQVDEEVAPGTCVVETPVGLTDLSPQTQIDNLEELLLSD